jgi:hypothetical protein
LSNCPIPMPGGGDCWRKPHPDSKHGICAEHWSAVIEDYRKKTTTAGKEDSKIALARGRCPVCGQFGTASPKRSWACENPMCYTDRIIPIKLTLASIAAAHWERLGIAMYLDQRPTDGWVYYLEFGRRVKIGTTTNLRSRLKAIPHDRLLAVERGSYDVERQRHRQFAKDRVATQREWFDISRELVDHINDVRRKNGDPYQMVEVHS